MFLLHENADTEYQYHIKVNILAYLVHTHYEVSTNGEPSVIQIFLHKKSQEQKH